MVVGLNINSKFDLLLAKSTKVQSISADVIIIVLSKAVTIIRERFVVVIVKVPRCSIFASYLTSFVMGSNEFTRAEVGYNWVHRDLGAHVITIITKITIIIVIVNVIIVVRRETSNIITTIDSDWLNFANVNINLMVGIVGIIDQN